MKYKFPIETDRLYLKAFENKDSTFFYEEFDRDELVMKYIGGVKDWGRDQQRIEFEKRVKAWNNSEFKIF